MVISMNKNSKVLYLIIALCIILVIALCIFLIVNHKEEQLTDALRFEQDFEKYNGLTYEDTKDDVIDVDIPSENPFVYKTGKEILNILEQDDAYVFFGYSSCPLTRAAISTLVEVASEKNVATIYYVDISDMRDEYEAGESIIPDKLKEGSEAYYKILDFFGDNLSEYYVSDETGFYLYDTGVKRLKSPTFVAVSGGKVLSMHEELVESYDYSNRELTNEEKSVLKENYSKVIDALQESSSD